MPTPHFRHTLIALSIAQAFSYSTAATAQSSDKTLEEVRVTAVKEAAGSAKRASVGGFAEAPLVETPASISVITQQQMQDLRIRQTSDAVRFDASVNDSYNAIGYAEQFSIRGFALDNSSSYRKDGLAIPSDAAIPLENKERLEILKGIAGFQAGAATPGGVINYVTKRPTATPLRSVTLEASERGTLYGALDLGGRFDDQRFGYRINAATEKLRSYVKGANGERHFVSGAFDWQISPKALLQLDMDYQTKSQLTAPGFQLINGTTLPNVSANTMLNNQPWSKPVDTRSSNIGLRFEYQINDDWRTVLSANQHSFKRDDYAAFPYGCASANLFPGFCANGDYDVYDYQSANESKRPLAAQALIMGKFATGAVKHEFTAGVSGFQRRDKFGDCVYGTLDCLGSAANGTSNIYSPIVVPASSISTGPVVLRRSETERSVFTQDILGLTTQLKLHAGVRYTQVKREQFDTAGVLNGRYDRGYLLPNAALVFSPQANLSLYGSYSQGLEHGGIAPLLTTNVNQVLDPSKSRQFELGIKADLARDLFVSAALFDIKKPLEYTNSAGTFVRNGDAVHRGLELAAQGKASANLTVGVSVTAMEARQKGTGMTTLDNKRVTNVPDFRSSAYVDYAVPQLVGLNLNAVWQHSGSKAFSPDNSVTVPGYDVVNLGARYRTSMAGAATTLRFNVDNVFDKFYWRDVTQALGGYLLPGAPRTFKVSAQFDF